MNKNSILTIIVLSQFFGTSLWFCSNAILSQIAKTHHLQQENLLAHLTIATQLGFIIGSLFYAFFNLADRYMANRVFTISIFLGALVNATILLPNLNFTAVYSSRFLTGLFLAGVYPVGMKIAAYFFPKTISNALGILVGALVLGTAFPHFVASFSISLNWSIVMLTSSLLAIVGGCLMLLLKVPAQKKIKKIDISVIPKLWQKKDFRKASFGYFGHMWELYTFWVFIPLLIVSYKTTKNLEINTSLWSFLIISSGVLGAIIAGKLALKKGSAKVAKFAMYTSAICCLLSPISLLFPKGLFLLYLLFWGISVVADSPLLSTLVNKTSIAHYNGTALTLSTSIGFLTTVISIAFFNYVNTYLDIQYVFTILSIGPVLGIVSIKKKS